MPVGTAFQYRCTGEVKLGFICITMPPWPGEHEVTFLRLAPSFLNVHALRAHVSTDENASLALEIAPTFPVVTESNRIKSSNLLIVRHLVY